MRDLTVLDAEDCTLVPVGYDGMRSGVAGDYVVLQVRECILLGLTPLNLAIACID